jgi:hypothetical protein
MADRPVQTLDAAGQLAAGVDTSSRTKIDPRLSAATVRYRHARRHPHGRGSERPPQIAAERVLAKLSQQTN